MCFWVSGLGQTKSSTVLYECPYSAGVLGWVPVYSTFYEGISLLSFLIKSLNMTASPKFLLWGTHYLLSCVIKPTIIFKSFFPLKHDEKSRGYPSYRGVEFY